MWHDTVSSHNIFFCFRFVAYFALSVCSASLEKKSKKANEDPATEQQKVETFLEAIVQVVLEKIRYAWKILFV